MKPTANCRKERSKCTIGASQRSIALSSMVETPAARASEFYQRTLLNNCDPMSSRIWDGILLMALSEYHGSILQEHHAIFSVLVCTVAAQAAAVILAECSSCREGRADHL